MPAAPSLRPASASSIGDEMTWLARLRAELEKGQAEFEGSRRRWETDGDGAPEVGASEAGASEGLRRWEALVAEALVGASEAGEPERRRPEIQSFKKPAESAKESAVPAVPKALAPPPDPLASASTLRRSDAPISDAPISDAPISLPDWYFAEAGQTLGPYSAAELRARLRDGRLKAETAVWSAAQGVWLPAEKSLLAGPPLAGAASALPTAPAGRTRRFCHACGTPVDASDRFCSNCGAAQRTS